MANVTTKACVLVLFLVMIMVSPFATVTEGRLLQDWDPAAAVHKFNAGEHKSQRLLRELGFDHSKLEQYRKLSAIVVPDRRSPGGPDSQHH